VAKMEAALGEKPVEVAEAKPEVKQKSNDGW
jgi:hypothetical protein